MTQLKCLRCNYEWESRLLEPENVRACPHCKSPVWNYPRSVKYTKQTEKEG